MLLLAWMILLKRLKESCWIELLLYAATAGIRVGSSQQSIIRFETITQEFPSFESSYWIDSTRFKTYSRTSGFESSWIKWSSQLEIPPFAADVNRNSRISNFESPSWLDPTLSWNRSDAAAKVHKSSSKVGHNKLNLKVGTILGLS